MLECTGAVPCPLDTCPPASLADSSSSNTSLSFLVGGQKDAVPSAPLADQCLGQTKTVGNVSNTPSSRESVGQPLISGDSESVSTLAARTGDSLAPRRMPPLPRNVVLDFGDCVGERVTRIAMNRAAAGEERVDPRAVVAVERAAMAKLRNPRLVSGACSACMLCCRTILVRCRTNLTSR